ncbi:unnamed protein product [Laminaria digitata]
MNAIADALGMGKLPTSVLYVVVGLVGAHILAFLYWVLRISTDKKRLEMRFKEE